MIGLTPSAILTFIVIVVAQSVGISLLPKTQGFTNIGFAIATVAMFTVSLVAMARLIQSGTNLGILIPLMASIIPLVSAVVGMTIYGESASPVRIALLVLACVFIGAASKY